MLLSADEVSLDNKKLRIFKQQQQQRETNSTHGYCNCSTLFLISTRAITDEFEFEYVLIEVDHEYVIKFRVESSYNIYNIHEYLLLLRSCIRHDLEMICCRDYFKLC